MYCDAKFTGAEILAIVHMDPNAILQTFILVPANITTARSRRRRDDGGAVFRSFW
jgi:hypothetical protein